MFFRSKLTLKQETFQFQILNFSQELGRVYFLQLLSGFVLRAKWTRAQPVDGQDNVDII